MRPVAILFVAEKKWSGKSTAAEHVASRWGDHAEVFHFAKAPYMAADCFTDPSLHKDEPNELGITKRQICIAISDAIKALHPDLPVLNVRKRILATIDEGRHVIFDDIRRPEDFHWLRSLGTVDVHVIEIRRPEDGTTDEDTWITDDVRQLWGDDRRVIENDGTFEFHKRALEVCNEILYGETEYEN